MEKQNTLLVVDEAALRSIIEEVVTGALMQVRSKPKRLYTRRQAADILSVSLMTLDRYIKDGLVPSNKVGSRVVIDADEFDSTVASGSVRRYKHTYGMKEDWRYGER